MSLEPVLGVDLGTTNSCVAVVLNGSVHVIPDETGDSIQASVVSFLEDGSVLVGNQARQESVVDPVNSVVSAKRLIGRSFDSEQIRSIRRSMPYRVVKGRQQESFVEIRGQKFALPEVSGMVLRRMKDIAEAYVGQPIRKAVITVPANFNDTQRQMTKLAGELAGIDVIRVINEPTAAALAYGYGDDVNARIAIYDFGGGTFDITLLDVRKNVFEVVSTAGDSFLGGDDFDDRLARYMIAAFKKQHDVALDDDPFVWGRLKHVAEKTKRELTETDKAIVMVHELAQDEAGAPLDLRFQLDRKGFGERCKDIVQRTFLICDEALRNARLTVQDLDEVVLVGGSTRMPLVREMVKQYFGREVLAEVNPDEVVAIGAAIQGAALVQDHLVEGNTGAHALLLDVAPQSLGIQSVSEIFEVLIERNAQIPCERTQVFTTTKDNQESVSIRIFQGESRIVAENTRLGEIELYGLRPAPRGQIQIEVTFEIDANGLVVVTARDLETGRAQAAHVRVSAGYDPDDIDAMRARSS